MFFSTMFQLCRFFSFFCSSVTLQKYTYIHCYLDNDLAGQKTVETIAGMYGRCVYNESNCYAGYKDLNDYLRGKKQ